MASRSHEAAGDGWGHDGEEQDDRGTAAGEDGPADRQHLRTRVTELEAELERRERRLQRVIDEYETLLDRRTDERDRTDGPLSRLADWLTG
jgi:molecular chaperone GrpE (heat shock protein)